MGRNVSCQGYWPDEPYNPECVQRCISQTHVCVPKSLGEARVPLKTLDYNKKYNKI